jgi:hypothetical protein
MGYSIRSITPRDDRILVRGTRYSGIGVMSLEGLHDVQIVKGTVNGDKFADFVTNTLIPIVIMDNASIHHVDEVTDLIESTAHAKVIFLLLT